MGKSLGKKSTDRRATSRSGKPSIARRVHSNSKQYGKSPLGKNSGSKKDSSSQSQHKLKIPFRNEDHVLLVGEGDFSFALSLAQYRKVDSMVATSYDMKDSLIEKYPHAEDIIKSLQIKRHDARHSPGAEEEFHGFSPSPPQSPIAERSSSPEALFNETNPTRSEVMIYHGIDATKLSTTHKKLMRRHGPFSKIVFNFPHVGGLSTDINRQTRANQKLIQGFFGAAKDFLVSSENPLRRRQQDVKDAAYDYEQDVESDELEQAQQPGQILVTLFTGEAYTDWNIRDIARDQGLRVVESFRFPWEAYPGYQHARTIGEVKTGKDRSSEGKRKGAWRGEEREARCFVFEVGDRLEVSSRKRKRNGEDSGSE